jgi:hypothetical protein
LLSTYYHWFYLALPSPAVASSLPSDARDPSAHSDGDGLRDVDRCAGATRVCGRDGGEGYFAIADGPEGDVRVTGRFLTTTGTAVDFSVHRDGDTYIETQSGRRGATPESVLPLVVRDAPWEMIAGPRRDAPRHAADDKS